MEAKHTKGPWRRIGRTIVDNQGRIELSVASTNDTEDAHVNENHRVEKSEAFANAQLISAAPELLRELKKCVAAIQKWGKAHPESGGWMGVISGGLKAIAQAEGGAQ